MSSFYLVSYAHSKGFGNMYFEADELLDIQAAQQDIRDTIEDQGAVILVINPIEKEQFVEKPND